MENEHNLQIKKQAIAEVMEERDAKEERKYSKNGWRFVMLALVLVIEIYLLDFVFQKAKLPLDDGTKVNLYTTADMARQYVKSWEDVPEAFVSSKYDIYQDMLAIDIVLICTMLMPLLICWYCTEGIKPSQTVQRTMWIATGLSLAFNLFAPIENILTVSARLFSALSWVFIW